MSKRAAPRPSPRHWKHIPRLNLTLEQVQNNWAALGFADHLELRPNLTLDIHFDRGDLFDPVNRASGSLQAFLKSARQWIERKGSKTAYIWVLESRGDSDGIHAHILIHVPPALTRRFHDLRPRWARKAGLNMQIGKVIHREDMPTLEATKGKLQYMSKDLHPKHWPIFQAGGRIHLHDCGKPSDQPIYGKKAGVSRNIDAKARASHQPNH
ncbi:rolling circle replication-associated protein [Altericroceibacterium xinjiangense]|uniref:rolling circle replication-associated protein n=1 Tax=Altericroceibacterium xinjiangense TaxID=762261 RepID=UPI000F7DA4D5|nr:hypothetical protein [Altericroceibacterium xinjiangense]